jgi:hypothetical protein
LVAVKQLDKTNNATIARFVNETLSFLYLPNQIPVEKVIYMVTDGAAYMVKAGHNLKLFFQNLIHVTCLAHAMNRVAEAVRTEFPLVNKLINNGKKVFVKAPTRVQVYKEMLVDVPLPVQTILTRWGTWIKAALFYTEHYGDFKNVVNSFDPNCAQSVAECQTIFKKPELAGQLAYIRAHFADIPTIIEKLETKNLPLTDAFKLVDDFNSKLSKNNTKTW